MDDTLRRAVEHYGADMQLNVCIEELSELIKELCKAKRGMVRLDDIAEEMADVKIVLKELEIIYENTAEVDAWYAAKVERLQKRLERGLENGTVY